MSNSRDEETVKTDDSEGGVGGLHWAASFVDQIFGVLLLVLAM